MPLAAVRTCNALPVERALDQKHLPAEWSMSELGGTAAGNDAPLIDKHHPVAIFGLVHVMRRHQNSDVFGSKVVD